MYIANLNLLDEAAAYNLCISSARNDLKIRKHLQEELEQEFAVSKQEVTDLMLDMQVWYVGTARIELIQRALATMAECQKEWDEHEKKNSEHLRVLRSYEGPRFPSPYDTSAWL